MRRLTLTVVCPRKKAMPTKRVFDLVLITTLLLHPAIGLVRMSSRRWAREEDGMKSKLGQALVVSL